MSDKLADMIVAVGLIGVGLFCVLYFRYFTDSHTRYLDWMWKKTWGRLSSTRNPWTRPSYLRFGRVYTVCAGIGLISLGVFRLIRGLLLA